MNRLCTIIALNYLPQAMALLDSTRKIYPEIEFFVLITDTENRDQKGLESATVLLPEDLDLPSDWLAEMRTYYDPVELATSFKPFLLRTLLKDGVASVTYLDPDILLFSELTDGMIVAENSGIAITPHRLTPVSMTNSHFNELSFLQYGIFNLGYIAVGQKALPMLQWWGERLRWYCTRFPNDVVFTDQKWINFVPAFYEHGVIRNPGYDFAPWNIDERPLSEVAGKFYVNGSPLIFIHFSQMSGALAAGRKTDLWEKGLEHSREGVASLKLISKLTDDYSATLIQFRDSIGGIPTTSAKKQIGSNASFHYRQKLIRKSIEANRENSDGATRVQTTGKSPDISKVIRLIERSATLNGARRGFSQDFPKITQRLRSFFHR